MLRLKYVRTFLNQELHNHCFVSFWFIEEVNYKKKKIIKINLKYKKVLIQNAIEIMERSIVRFSSHHCITFLHYIRQTILSEA